MQLPTEEQIRALHHRYAPTQSAFDEVYAHCCIVRDIATQLIDRHHLAVDAELVRVGCMLHDIGVYSFFSDDGSFDSQKPYLQHGILGEAILHAENFPEILCRFASHHTGVGLSKEAIEQNDLPLPHQDFLAETPEEALVMYADKFNSKSGGQGIVFNSADYYRKHARQFGEANVQAFDALIQRFGEPDLDLLARQYNAKIR